MKYVPPAVFGLTVAMALPGALAQSAPDAGNLLREIERQQSPRPDTPALPQAASPSGPRGGEGVQVTVRAFRLVGVTLLPEEEVQRTLAPWVGQPSTFDDLRRAADAVAELYRRRGYLVRAYLPDQDVRDGGITLAVLEGRLAAVRIERAAGSNHVGDALVNGYMTARQQVGEPVRPDDLQRAVSLLNELPGVTASSMLEPGEREGESRLVVSVQDKPRFAGFAQVDNTGSKATGEVRATLGLYANSPLSIGDQLQLLLNKSRGSSFGNLLYGLPLGHDGLRLQANVLKLQYGYTLNGTRYTGSADALGLALQYPLWRTTTANANLGLSHERKGFDNLVAGIGLSDKTLRISTATFSGDRLDDWLGGGLLQYGVNWSEGRLDLAGNGSDLAADQLANGPRRHGHYRKVTASLNRLQRLTAADTLAVLGSAQWASRNLDSAEKFLATGPYAVRAYASSEPGADDGALLSIEWRRQLGEALTTTVFHDRAYLKRDHDVNVASLSPNGYHLAGSGVSVSYGRATDVQLRASVAWRHGSNPVHDPQGRDADGTRRNPRVFLSILKTF